MHRIAFDLVVYFSLLEKSSQPKESNMSNVHFQLHFGSGINMCECAEKRPSEIDKIEIIGTILEFIFTQNIRMTLNREMKEREKTIKRRTKVMKIVYTTFALDPPPSPLTP